MCRTGQCISSAFPILSNLYLFQCVMPFYVVTKMIKIRNPNILVPGPQDFARQSLGTLGVSAQTNGYWSHALQVGLSFALTPPSQGWESEVRQLLVN